MSRRVNPAIVCDLAGVHEYLFTITSVHDGDTFSGRLDQGFYLGMDVNVRIFGVNAPELTVTRDGHRILNPAGEDATQYLLALLGGPDRFSAGRTRSTFGIPGDYIALYPIQCVVRTRIKSGDGDYEKYGRVLADVHLGASDDPFGVDVGAAMVSAGFAVPYSG